MIFNHGIPHELAGLLIESPLFGVIVEPNDIQRITLSDSSGNDLLGLGLDDEGWLCIGDNYGS